MKGKQRYYLYARFLDYCHERILLRKVGGGYIFVHRLLQEYFARSTPRRRDRSMRLPAPRLHVAGEFAIVVTLARGELPTSAGGLL